MRTDGLDATIFSSASLLALASVGKADDAVATAVPRPAGQPGEYAGHWHSVDGTVRLHLAEDWSYEGTVAGRRRSARGTYRIDGAGLMLSDDSGLRTRVERGEYCLEMAGHELFKII